MADIGEKVYFASESDAQEILASLDNIATNNSLIGLNTIFENGLVVKGKNRVKQWKLGKLQYSTYVGGAYPSVEFTGSGIVHITMSTSSGSNFLYGAARLTIDGTLMTSSSTTRINTANSGHQDFSVEFKTSIKIECIDSEVDYFVGLY